MGLILEISYNKFPNGDAGAVRSYVLAKLFSSIGFDTFFADMGFSNYLDIREYNGFKYTSLRINQEGNNLLGKIRNYFGYQFRLRKFINSFIRKNKPEYILVTTIPLFSLIYIKRIAKKNNIRLLHDSVEWYSRSQFVLRSLSPVYIEKNIINRFVINKNFNVISISRYLENYFKEKHINTVRIPAILDIEAVKCVKSRGKKLTIIYAGSPKNKDLLHEVFKGMSLLSDSELEKVEIRLIGINTDECKKVIVKAGLNAELLCKSFRILGTVNRDEVFNNYMEADFSILARPNNERYAKAGFPTKVVESLATGTPVILNLTSDLHKYLSNMKDAVIMEEGNGSCIAEAIRKTLLLTTQQKDEMSKNARICAENFFDYRQYADLMKGFLENKK